LISSGRGTDTPEVSEGLAVVAGAQNEDGGWGADGTSEARETAEAMLTLRAAGFDPDEVCWQQELRPAAPAKASPSAFLIATQADDGAWGNGDEAVSTAMALQAMGGQWLPIVRADERTCGDGFEWPLDAVPPGLLVIGGVGLIGVFGSIRILRGDQTGI
jgi:hypothetical protein